MCPCGLRSWLASCHNVLGLLACQQSVSSGHEPQRRQPCETQRCQSLMASLVDARYSQAVDTRRSRRALLAVPNGCGDFVYPACQFTPDGVIPGLEEVVRRFKFGTLGPNSPIDRLLRLVYRRPRLRTTSKNLSRSSGLSFIRISHPFRHSAKSSRSSLVSSGMPVR